MDTLDGGRWLHLVVTTLFMLLCIASVQTEASWRFPDSPKRFQSIKHMVHPLYSSYNSKSPNSVDRSFTISSEEEVDYLVKPSQKFVPASAPHYRAPIVDRNLEQPYQNLDASRVTDDATALFSDTSHSLDYRVPPAKLVTLGDTIQVADDQKQTEDPRVAYPFTVKTSHEVSRSQTSRADLAHNGKESTLDANSEPFVAEASILRPRTYPLNFQNQFSSDKIRRRGSLRFPEGNRSGNIAQSFSSRVDGLPLATKMNNHENVDISNQNNHINNMQGLNRISLKEFQDAGGFHNLGMQFGGFAFDGHSNIIYKSSQEDKYIDQGNKNQLSPTVATSNPQSDSSALSSSANAFVKPSRSHVSLSQRVPRTPFRMRNKRIRTSKNYSRINNGSNKQRKRHYNNIAEIIEAQEERERQRVQQVPHVNTEMGEQFSTATDDQSSYERTLFSAADNGQIKQSKKLKRGASDGGSFGGLNSHYGLGSLHHQPSIHFQSLVNYNGLHAKTSRFVNQPFIHQSKPVKSNINFVKHAGVSSVHHEPYYSPKSNSKFSATSHQHSSFKSPTYFPKPLDSYVHRPTQFPKYKVSTLQKRDPYSGHGHNYYQPPRDYQFGYDVKSYKHRTRYLHREAREGHKVSGEYRVQLPDGRVQIVRYTADENGYHPIITYTRPDNAGSAQHGSAGQGHNPVSHSQFNTFH